VTLTNGPDAHDETNLARCDPCLVGVHHDAWVAECGTLDGVFTRKGGTKEEPTSRRQLAVGVEAIRKLVGMLQERFGQTMMSPTEPGHHIIKTLLHFFVRQLQNSL
jgi:hypothetical protein